MAVIPRDPFAKEPAEGSREIVERELKRRGDEMAPDDPDTEEASGTSQSNAEHPGED